MEDFNTWARNYVELSALERNRIRLLVDSYNLAVTEIQSAENPIEPNRDGSFQQRDIDRLVRNFHRPDYAKMGPALRHYLRLLEIYVYDRRTSMPSSVQ